MATKKVTRQRKKPTIEAILKVLAAKAGNLTETAKAFKVNRRTIYNWMNSSTAYKNAMEDHQESLIDFVESKLMQSINNGSDTATIFFLKTRAKTRGYVEKSEVDHTTKGESINKAIDKLTDEELEQKILALRDKMK